MTDISSVCGTIITMFTGFYIFTDSLFCTSIERLTGSSYINRVVRVFPEIYKRGAL